MALIWEGQFGGLADSKWSGILGSFAECVGIDGHSTPGLLKVHQALKKESGATVDSFVKIKVAVSTGESFWFSSTSGKIWRRSSTGTWLLVHTTTAAAGGHGCLGAHEYNGYLYWATESRLHRISMSTDHATVANWTANAVEDWATFAVTDDTFHPMAIQDLTLFIGDGNRVASIISDDTFDNNALDIKTPFRVSAMIPFEIDLLIGTYVADTVNRAEAIRWDCVSTSWNTSDPIEEPGINAFIRDDNYVYAQAGRAGNIYLYNGEQLVPFKKIPGTYSNTAYGKVHPGSVGNFKGVPIFGFSNGSGNPAKQGVYSFGSYSRDYNKVLDLSFPISERSAGALVTSGIEIGAIMVADFDIVVAWKNGATYGVDVIDYSNKLTLAYLETIMLAQKQRDILKTLAEVSAFYNSLPASTGITFSYSINGAAYVEMTPVTNAKLNQIMSQLSVQDVGSLQIKVAFTVNSNDAPSVESLGLKMK
ncbi:hypothetical protein KAJ89_04040 [Candidatus Parcubacteria bacterium]|nr:hypothetical protein [Candidatus Parcubacteria bacterium]